MPENNGENIQMDLADKGTTLSVEGEIPCLLVFSDRKHVEYIYNIVNCIEEYLSQNGFSVNSLSDDTLSDEHFGKRFEELAQESVLGIIILDGFRPNILYEYGFLRGKGKQVVLLQDTKAFVAVKSFYSVPKSSTGDVVKDITGLTKTQFEHLREPPIGHFYHLSDRHGIRVISIDCAARSDSPDHPKNKIEKELKKLMPKIVEKYSEQSLTAIKNISPDYFQKFHTLVLKISEYYAGVEKFCVVNVNKIMSEIQSLEESSGVNMPSRVYGNVASLYKKLAEKTEWKNVRAIIEYYSKAIEINERILEFETDFVSKSNTQKRIGDICLAISPYHDLNENCKKAIKAYKEALKVYTKKEFPQDYHQTERALRRLLGFCKDK